MNKRKYYHQRRLDNDRKNRAERVREKKEGRIEERRLHFLLKLMKQKGLTYAALGRLTGLSKQNLYHYFELYDDMKLSQAEKICEKLGYLLSFTIRHKGRAELRSPESSAMPAVLKAAALDPSCRLHELAVFLMTQEYSVATFVRRTNIDRGMIYRPFRPDKDDISISGLLEIVSAMGYSVTFVLTKISGRGPSTIIVPAKRKVNNYK